MRRVETLSTNRTSTTPDFSLRSAFQNHFGRKLLLSVIFLAFFLSSFCTAMAQNVQDATAGPKIVSFTPERNPSNKFTIELKIKISEEITGLDADDITLTNAKLHFVTGFKDTFTAYIDPESDGEIKASIKPNSFADLQGNTNKNGASLTVISDRTSPHFDGTHIFDVDEKDPKRLRVQLNITEPVVGFEFADIKLTNTSGSNKVKLEDFSGKNAHYEFYIRNSGEPVIEFMIESGAFEDLAGNKILESEQFFIGQNIVPVIVKFEPEKEITNADIIPISVKFSKNVTGFDTSDVRTVGATPQKLSGAGDEYHFELVPTGDGVVTATIEPGAVVDESGNANTEGKTLRATVDRTKPLIETFTADKFLTNANSDAVTVTFTEPVTGFDQSDIVLSNGAKVTNFQKIGESYHFDLEPGIDGPITATIGAGAVTDIAGNTNPDTKALTVIFDRIDPAITELKVEPEVEGSDHLVTVVKLSEPVTGFDASDIKLNGFILDNFSGSGDSYRFFLTPDGTGNESITIDANSFADLAGNRNHEKRVFEISPSQITTDELPPEIVDFLPARRPNLGKHAIVHVEFSEQITGLEPEDIILSNGAVLDRLSGSEDFYTLELTLVTETTQIEIPVGSFADLTGNTNTKAGNYTVSIESSAPEIINIDTVTKVTNQRTIPVTLTFSEPVEDFDASDINLPEGVSLTNFSGADNRYSFDLIPTKDGAIEVNIPETSFADRLGVFNNVATNFEIEVDYTAPSVTLIGAPSSAGTPYTLLAKFSEPVIGLHTKDFDVKNATISEIAGSGSEYTLKIVPLGLEHSVELPENRVTDLAGNGNTTAGHAVTESDKSTAPTIKITGLPVTFLPDENLEVTFTFVEPQKGKPVPVTGFTTEDLRITNGEVTQLSGSGSVYKATIRPHGKGNLTVKVEENAAYDKDGQGSRAASAMSRIDSPTITGKAVTEFLATRARNLAQLQPELISLLKERKRFNFDGSIKGKNFIGNIDVAQEAFWAWAAGAANKDKSGSNSRYSLAAFGHFFAIHENLLLGTMVQVDNTHGIYDDNVEISGTGYLVGPYIVGKTDNDPIFYEARLLYGTTRNRISPFGTFTDKFSGHRWLAKVKIEGEYVWKTVTLRPAFSALHLHDSQHAYVDSLFNYIDEHGIALSEFDLGMKFEMPLGDNLKRYRLVGGLSGLWAQQLGLGAAPSYLKSKAEHRVRLDAGLRYNDGKEVSGSVGAFLDGIGTSRKTHGMTVQLQIHF